MRKLLMGTALCRDLPVNYYLLAEMLRDGTETYGVLVEYGQEQEKLPAITISQQEIHSLLSALMEGCVTPVTLRDVVEDWLLA